MGQALAGGSVLVVCLITLGLSMFALRLSRRTSDFYVAGRVVSPARNAAAIGGEYLSAASFLGVAGLIYDTGVDALWYPIGYTVGYVVLLALVAAPLRRSGAYTLPDFAEARLESRVVRHLCSVLAVLIGWLYLIPQFQGAGFTLGLVTGAPLWLGSSVVLVVVGATVVVVVGLMVVGLIVGSVVGIVLLLGRVSGREFLPDRFEVRHFSFLEIPLLRVQVAKILREVQAASFADYSRSGERGR